MTWVLFLILSLISACPWGQTVEYLHYLTSKKSVKMLYEKGVFLVCAPQLSAMVPGAGMIMFPPCSIV